jgi:hypothetical protein
LCLGSKDAVVEQRHARKVVKSQIEAWDSNPRNPSGLETLVVVRNEGLREGYESAICECGRGYGAPSLKLHDFILTHTVAEDPRPEKTRDDVLMPLLTCEDFGVTENHLRVFLVRVGLGQRREGSGRWSSVVRMLPSQW